MCAAEIMQDGSEGDTLARKPLLSIIQHVVGCCMWGQFTKNFNEYAHQPLPTSARVAWWEVKCTHFPTLFRIAMVSHHHPCFACSVDMAFSLTGPLKI